MINTPTYRFVTWPLTSSHDLDLGLRATNVNRDTSSWCKKQLYAFMWKSDEAFESYGAETKHDLWPLAMTLTLIWRVRMLTVTHRLGVRNNCVHLCENRLKRLRLMERKRNVATWPLTSSHDLDLGLRGTNVNRDTSSWCKEQLCAFMWKSVKAFETYGAETKCCHMTFDL